MIFKSVNNSTKAETKDFCLVNFIPVIGKVWIQFYGHIR